MSGFLAISTLMFLSSKYPGFHASKTKITCKFLKANLGLEEHLLSICPHILPPFSTSAKAHSPSSWSPSTVIHQAHSTLRNKTYTSVPPSLVTTEDGSSTANFRINKGIPKAISAAWHISKHITLGQKGASHPGWITSLLFGKIYLMQMKNQTFVNQLNKKLRGKSFWDL